MFIEILGVYDHANILVRFEKKMTPQDKYNDFSYNQALTQALSTSSKNCVLTCLPRLQSLVDALTIGQRWTVIRNNYHRQPPVYGFHDKKCLFKFF